MVSALRFLVGSVLWGRATCERSRATSGSLAAALVCLVAMVAGPRTASAEDVFVEFGALTPAGQGGIEIGPMGEFPGGLPEHFAIVDDRIVPSQLGDAVDLDAAPYRILMNGNRTLVVEVLPRTFSVSNFTELRAAVAAPVLQFGDSILLRGGVFVPASAASARLERAEPPLGDPKKDGVILVSSHKGAAPSIQHMKLGKNTSDFRYEGLIFRTRKAKGTKSRGAVHIVADLSGLVFANNRFEYGKRITGSEGDIIDGIASNARIRVDRLRVVGNSFDGVMTAMGPLRGDSIEIDRNTIRRAGSDDIRINRGRDLRITNNLLTDKILAMSEFRIVDIRSDGAGGMVIQTDRPIPKGRGIEHVVISPDTGVNPAIKSRDFGYRRDFDRDRDIDRSKKTLRIRTVDFARLPGGYSGGGRLWTTNVHGDAIQIFPGGFQDGDLDNVTIAGNVILIGDGSVGFNSRQGGIWVDSGKGGKPKRNWLIAGNLIEHTGRSGMAIRGLVDARVLSNVVVRRFGYPNVSGINATMMILQGTGAVFDNVSNRFKLGWRGPMSGNIEIKQVTAQAYRATFANPPLSGGLGDVPDYDWRAYLPGRSAPSGSGIGGWDFKAGIYRGRR